MTFGKPSRAAAVRSAIANALVPHVDGTPIDQCTTPVYRREDLADGHRICVWASGRELTVDMVDERMVQVAVGIIGQSFVADGFSLTDQALAKQELEHADKYDGMLESLLDLWMPDGDDNDGDETATLRFTGMAEHSFETVTQPTFVDVAMYRENGVWLSAFFLTYRDSRD